LLPSILEKGELRHGAMKFPLAWSTTYCSTESQYIHATNVIIIAKVEAGVGW